MLEDARVPCGKVNTAREVLDDPHIRARETLVHVDYPGVGKVPIPGVPIKLSETPGKIENPAPGLGAHNKEIYCDLLKYSEDEYDALVQDGVM
jgi:CoA:oxalate CoA-transferase